MKFVQCLVGILLAGALLVDEIDAAVYRSRQGMPLPMRLRRLHHRSAMYGEYYQPQPQMMYIPAMTTYTAGDSFTGYLDPVQAEDKPCSTCNNIPEEPELEPEPIPEPEPLPEFEETTRVHKVEIEQEPEEQTGVSTATQIPVFEETSTQKTKTKITPKKRPQPEEEEDEEEDYDDWPYVKNQGRKVPPYNVFFPMMFGYPGSGRSGQNGGHPGGVTAIANSFSSGKGGVATSHATAFGNAPALNKHNQWKRRSQHDD